MDHYLNPLHTYQRLVKEFYTYKALVIAYDFDNTVYDYHQQGITFDQVIGLLRELKALGCYLIIFTANADTQFVIDHCQTLDIPFDAINEQPPFFQSTGRKIYYNALLDDRAGLREVYDALKKLVKENRPSA